MNRNPVMHNRLYAYLNTAAAILQSYGGGQPFAPFIKDFFRQHKKHGSSDRKHITNLCYCFFRLGHAFSQETTEQKLLIGQFLCNIRSDIFIEDLKPEWYSHISDSLHQKLKLLKGENEWQAIFPFSSQLSPEVERNDFIASLLIQPYLFLRIRSGYEDSVKGKLAAASLAFQSVTANAISLPNSSKVEEVIAIDREAVIQDLSSQQVLTGLAQRLESTATFTAWDCCAASGGKSVLLHDLFPNVKITVSDIRESILINLRARLGRAGITGYRSFVGDIGASHFKILQQFNVVICDAPCSGSGTWGRTPEWLLFFKKEKIGEYASLQKKIAANAARSVKPGGYFLYITCSVFSPENEEVATWLGAHTQLQLLEATYYKGYHQKADTLFTALFRR